jgi:cytochrome P450
MMADERGLLETIVKEGKKLGDDLGLAADTDSDSQTPIAVDSLTTKAAVGVVLFFLFGRDLEFDAEEMRVAANDLMACLFMHLTNPAYEWMKHVPGTNAYPMEVRKKHAQETIDNVVAAEIDVLLEEYNGTRPVHPDRKSGSVIASLIENEPRFRKGGTASMIAEARVFIQAGFETTAHSLAFSLGMMAERPDLADKLAQQAKEILGDYDGEDIDDSIVEKIKTGLEKCPLFKNFFLEAIRLYPLAPALAGECVKDISIVAKDGVTYKLPKGTATVFLNIPLQRHVPDPETIRPDRWDAPPSQQPFLNTFQNGPHACPGKPLSLLEGQVFLLLAAHQFEFSFPNGIDKVEAEDNLLLRPKNGMPLLVKRRR